MEAGSVPKARPAEGEVSFPRTPACSTKAFYLPDCCCLPGGSAQKMSGSLWGSVPPASSSFERPGDRGKLLKPKAVKFAKNTIFLRL